MQPTVSVIVPNYNHSRYLRERIDSVLNQTYQDFELILLDDCSTDDSRDIISSYANDPHVSHVVFNETNTGNTFIQWQRGIGLAKGEYIWIAESDDAAHPQLLEALVTELHAHPHSAVAYSHSQIIDSNGQPMPYSWHQHGSLGEVNIYDGMFYVEHEMLLHNSIYNASMAVFRRSVFSRIPTDYRKYRYCGDWLFWVYVCRSGDVIEVCRPLNYYRQHIHKVTVNSQIDGRKWRDDANILRRIMSVLGLNKVQRLCVRGRWSKRFCKENGKNLSDIRHEYSDIYGGGLPCILLYELGKLTGFQIDHHAGRKNAVIDERRDIRKSGETFYMPRTENARWLRYLEKISIAVGRTVATIVSALVPQRELRHKVRYALNPLNDERCVDYIYRHYVKNCRTTFVPASPSVVSYDDCHVWQCWLQGEQQAPQLVKDCIASVRRNLQPGQKHVVITADNFSQYVTLPDYVIEKWHQGKITNTHFSDLLRIHLLAQHGGYWIDATCLMLAPLPRWTASRPVFFYHSEGEFAFTHIQSCFMFSQPTAYTMHRWCDIMDAYWKVENRLFHYFLLHLVYKALLESDLQMREEHSLIPQYNDGSMHLLLNAANEGRKCSNELLRHAATLCFLQKTTYKMGSAEQQKAIDDMCGQALSLPADNSEKAIKEEPLVSLIVAVYNTQKYLPACIDSIINQTYQNWELLLMDDGSSDGSAEMCDEYAAKDSRIRVIHKENTGKADSCNRAIAEARGHYVTVIDSDDWVEPSMLRILTEAMQKTGMMCAGCGWFDDFVDVTVPNKVSHDLTPVNKEGAIRMFYNQNLFSFICTRMFVRDTIIHNPIPLIKKYEDQAVLYKWIAHGNGIALCPEVLYHYRQRGSSIMNSSHNRNEGLLSIIAESHRYIIDRNLMEEADSKVIAVRQMTRIGKNLARNTSYKDSKPVLQELRRQLSVLLPLEPKEKFPTKVINRVDQLMRSLPLFWFSSKISGLFVTSKYADHDNKKYE